MKPTLIIDCSITMAWCFANESTAETIQIQDRLAMEAALVPSHWHLEVTNVLAMAEKHKRLTPADSTQFIQLLSVLDIQVDEELSRQPPGYLLPFCRDHNLTSYDAAYLELVVRHKLPLASLDNPLRKAAISLGDTVLGK